MYADTCCKNASVLLARFTWWSACAGFVMNPCHPHTGLGRRRSIIEESEDQDASRMQAKLDFVPIDQLAKYIGNKVRRRQSVRESTALGSL